MQNSFWCEESGGKLSFIFPCWWLPAVLTQFLDLLIFVFHFKEYLTYYITNFLMC